MTGTHVSAAGDLAGQVAVVVGASRGIGAAVAARMATAGATVVLGGRDAEALEEPQVRSISSEGLSAEWRLLDVRDERSVAGFFAGVIRDHGRLDVAVNNATVTGRFPVPLAEASAAEFDELMAVNLRGTFLCLRQELSAMAVAGAGGAIVNMSSTAGEHGVAGLAPTLPPSGRWRA